MPRSQANVQFTIWAGLKGASPLAKLVYQRLLTEETMTQCGVGALLVDQFAEDLELPIDLVNDLLEELEAKRYAYVDRDAHRFLVRTLVRNDGIADVPNVLWAAMRAAKMVRSPKLRRVLAAELRKLPPKPADKVTPVSGKPDRIYVYPDPHATADEIDPGPEHDEPPPAREPSPAGNGRTAGIPSPSDAASQAHPIATQHREAAAEMGSGWDAGSPGGGGGGGGGGKTPVTTTQDHVLEGVCSQARAHTREDAPTHVAEPDPAPPAPAGAGRTHRNGSRPARGDGFIGPGGVVLDLPVTKQGGTWSIINAWRAGHSPAYRQATYRELARHVDGLLARGAPPDVVRAALDAWDARPGHASPGLLPHLYDDAVRAARNPVAAASGPARKPTRVELGATSGQRALAARRARLATEGGPPPSTSPPLPRTGRA